MKRKPKIRPSEVTWVIKRQIIAMGEKDKKPSDEQPPVDSGTEPPTTQKK